MSKLYPESLPTTPSQAWSDMSHVDRVQCTVHNATPHERPTYFTFSVFGGRWPLLCPPRKIHHRFKNSVLRRCRATHRTLAIGPTTRYAGTRYVRYINCILPAMKKTLLPTTIIPWSFSHQPLARQGLGQEAWYHLTMQINMHRPQRKRLLQPKNWYAKC